jgi:hypothetical protein
MADSPLKIKPVKDLIDEILDGVEPVATYKIGDKIIEWWKADHISEKHHLRYVAIQVEQMVAARQYQALLNRLNYLSDLSEISDEEREEIPVLSRKFAEKSEELMPLNCQWLEALAELEPGELMGLIEGELTRRNLRKSIPIAKFINDLAGYVRKATDPEAEQALEASEEDEDSDPLVEETFTVEATLAPSPSENNEKLLVSTSST